MPERSARIQGGKVLDLNLNHTSLNKFNDSNDESYQKILTELHLFYDNVPHSNEFSIIITKEVVGKLGEVKNSQDGKTAYPVTNIIILNFDFRTKAERGYELSVPSEFSCKTARPLQEAYTWNSIKVLQLGCI